MKRIVAFVLFFLIAISFSVPVFANELDVNDDSNNTNNQVIVNDFYNAITSKEFTDNGAIYVVMHHEVSDVGKFFDESFFPELEIESIHDYTVADLDMTKEEYGENFRNILKIILKNKSRENVISSIFKLQDRADQDIYWAQPEYNIQYNLHEETQDTSIESNSYSLSRTATDTSSYAAFDKICLDDAWEITTGSSDIKVAVVDTGVLLHPDLIGNLSDSYLSGMDREYEEMGVDASQYHSNPGSVRVNINYSEDSEYNEIEQKCDMNNSGGTHGTNCAGIIGASNNTHVPSICQNVTIIPIYFNPNANYFTLLVDFLHKYSISFANISISTSFSNENIPVITQIMNNYSGLWICAAGNSYANMDDPPIVNGIEQPQYAYPAKLTCNNIITVGASDLNDNVWTKLNDNGSIATGSYYGAYSVDLFAPNVGIDMLTATDNGFAYSTSSGHTSYSAPIVTGVAALMKAANPNLTNLQIKAILMNTVDRNNALLGKCVSGGRLNAYEAVRIAHQLAQDNPSLTQDDIDKSNFLFHGSSCEIIKYVGNQTAPIIPGIINGFTVSKIADSAFRTMNHLKSINIPENITEIGEKAFRGCSSLESVTIPSSITVIPASAFQGCKKLKEVNLPNTLTSIKENAFLVCGDLESISLPASLQDIATSSFDSSVLLYITFDSTAESETQIAYNYAISNGMSYCIVSGNTITYYSDGNNSISRDLILPSSFIGTPITSIGDLAFEDADNIVSVVIPSSITSIGYMAFHNCDMLRTVTLPSTNTSISISNNMNSTIVDGSTNAVIYCARGSYAYAYSLTTDATFIYLSLDDTNKTASIDGIKESSNSGTEYYFPETFYEYTVTSVASSAFGTNILDEKRVTKIYVPETVESIGYNAFSSCANLTDIYIYSEDTELGSNCLPPYNRDSITIHCYMPSPAFLYATGNGYSYNLL